MINTTKFRASFSVLNLWASGNYEEAVKAYFKIDSFETPAMKAGKLMHEMWEQEIRRSGRLPVLFGGKELKTPWVEKKIEVHLQDWLELVGVIDCLDGATIYEFKSGKTESQAYARSMQCGVYAVLCTYVDIFVDKIEIHHYDQYKKRADMSIVWITDQLLQDSLNWIVTMSGEMHNYMVQNKLYERFGSQPTGLLT